MQHDGVAHLKCNECVQEHISEAAVAQLGEQRTLRLHAFTCRGFGGPQEDADSPAKSPPEEPSYPSDTAKSLDDTIQDAVARAKAKVSPLQRGIIYIFVGVTRAGAACSGICAHSVQCSGCVIGLSWTTVLMMSRLLQVSGFCDHGWAKTL